jgi:cytochrome bd-type quinol oxidase subunit 2
MVATRSQVACCVHFGTNVGMKTSRRIIEIAAAALIVLNLLDAIFTLLWVESGIASEGNPIMDRAMTHGPIGFMVIKLALVSLCVLLLWRLRHRRAAAVSLVTCAIAYSAVMLVHLSAVPVFVSSLH